MKDDEQFTQDALRHLTRVEPSAELRRLVAEIPIKHPREARSYWPFANLWMPSFAMAAVAVLGLFVGRGLPDPGSAVSALETRGSAQTEAAESDPDPRPLENPDLKGEGDSGDALETGATESEAELDELLVLATAGDFAVDDWDLSEAPDDQPEEGTF